MPLTTFWEATISATLVALVAASAVRQSGGAPRPSFSMSFDDDEIDEGRYQRLMARHLGCEHHEIRFSSDTMIERLQAMVLHGECPVKETFNACSLATAASALSRAERSAAWSASSFVRSA